MVTYNAVYSFYSFYVRFLMQRAGSALVIYAARKEWRRT